MAFYHKSVLLDEVMEYMKIRPDGIYVDGTLGGAGHSCEIAKKLQGSGRLIGMDQDADAIEAARARLEAYAAHVTILHSNYCNMKKALKEMGITKVDGILLDLGVSSFQLDAPHRGFTYRDLHAPLDMRMDGRQTQTAEDIVNDYSETELFRMIRDYGEERFAKKIAKRITEARKTKRIQTAGELTELIRSAMPKRVQAVGGHPAKRTFQAIRIELNHELEVLEHTMDDMADLLHAGGRLCIITFHSLEDRIVKTHFKKYEHPCTCPRNFPVCVCGKEPIGACVTKKPILPTEEEIVSNPRAKSAKLRVFEKR